MPDTLSREQVIDQLATMIRDEAYPEFGAAPPPEWAMRAAAKVIDYHQPMLRDVLVKEAVTARLDALTAAVEELTITDEPSDPITGAQDAGYNRAIAAVLAILRGEQ